MQYCEVKNKGIMISLPENVERLERVILASAMDYGAFGEAKGTSVDEENGNHRHIVVTFPEDADEKAVYTFAEKVDNAIRALIELNAKFD